MIPKYIQPFLWSYDISKMDLKKDKKRIITNVLNLGTQKATDWLFSTYKRDEIKENISSPMPGEWNKKSLNFWGIIFDIEPKVEKRKVK